MSKKKKQNKNVPKVNAARRATPVNGKNPNQNNDKRKANTNGRQTAPTPREAPKRQNQAKPHVSPEKERHNQRTHKEYDKAVRERAAVSKRRRGSRGGNYILYYILAGIVLVIVLVVLAKTVLFNVSEIIVEGNARYTSEEIISYSGLELGESLLSVDTESAEEKIIGSLSYIDMARVHKVFPTKLKIVVNEAEKWFGVEQSGETAIISRMGKIIEKGADSKLTIVRGYEAETLEVGKKLVSKEEGKNTLPADILKEAEEAGIKKITEIDITDRFDIKVICDSRITLDLGSSTDLASKMNIAAKLIKDKIGETENVTVILTNPEKVYVRDNNNDDVIPVLPPSTVETLPETGETFVETGESIESGE